MNHHESTFLNAIALRKTRVIELEEAKKKVLELENQVKGMEELLLEMNSGDWDVKLFGERI